MASQDGHPDAEKAYIEQSEKSDLHDRQLGHLADQEDHEAGILESFRKDPWVSAWCIYAIWCVILISFDTQAGGAVVGIPQFRKDFGYEYDGDYVLPAGWQSAFNGAPIAS